MEVSVLLSEMVRVTARTQVGVMRICSDHRVLAMCAWGRCGKRREKWWEPTPDHCTGLALYWQNIPEMLFYLPFSDWCSIHGKPGDSHVSPPTPTPAC